MFGGFPAKTTPNSLVTVLPTAYLPPISWFAQLALGEPIILEQYENYHKQTLRNRCTIDSPSGPLSLTVPIDKSNFSSGAKCLVRDLRISYRTPWNHQHWNALQTSYLNSPFFEYLQDDFFPIYQHTWTYLNDLNEALIHTCCQLLDLHPQLSRSSDYMAQTPQNWAESPLQRDFKPKPYYQVFAHKHGFLPDLSILDLIFNMGPEGILYLQS